MKSIKESMKAIANAYYEEEISEEEEIRADAVREFAKWINDNIGFNCRRCQKADSCPASITDCTELIITEYEKEKKNV